MTLSNGLCRPVGIEKSDLGGEKSICFYPDMLGAAVGITEDNTVGA